MLKWIILAAVCWILYKMLVNDHGKKARDKSDANAKKAQEGLMVKDPICGAYVSVDSGIRVKEGEEVRCFCSYECRDKYMAKLER